MDMNNSIWYRAIDQLKKISDGEVVYYPLNIWGSQNPLFRHIIESGCGEPISFLNELMDKQGLAHLYALNMLLAGLFIKVAESTFSEKDIELLNIKNHLDNLFLKYPKLKKFVNPSILLDNIKTVVSTYSEKSPMSSQMQSIEFLHAYSQYLIENLSVGIHPIERSKALFNGYLYAGCSDEEVLTYLAAVHQEIHTDAIQQLLAEWESRYDSDNGFSGLIKNPIILDFVRILRLCQAAKINDYDICFKPIADSIELIAPETILRDNIFYRRELWHHFYLFYSDISVYIFEPKLKNLLFHYHSLLKQMLEQKAMHSFQDYDCYELVSILASTYIFGSYRLNYEYLDIDLIESSLIYLTSRNKPWNLELNYKNEFALPSLSVSLAARLIHAFSYLPHKSANDFIESAGGWLIREQTDYGQWLDDRIADPLIIMVLVLDAIKIYKDESNRRLTYKGAHRTVKKSGEEEEGTLIIDRENQTVSYKWHTAHIGGTENWDLLVALLEREGKALKNKEISDMTGRYVEQIPVRIGELKKFLKDSNAEFLIKAIKNQRMIGYYFDKSALCSQ